MEAEKLKLENNHFYFFLLGELYTNIDNNKAKFNFKRLYGWPKHKLKSRVFRRKSTILNEVYFLLILVAGADGRDKAFDITFHILNSGFCILNSDFKTSVS